jgi:hypothetical protein
MYRAPSAPTGTGPRVGCSLVTALRRNLFELTSRLSGIASRTSSPTSLCTTHSTVVFDRIPSGCCQWIPDGLILMLIDRFGRYVKAVFRSYIDAKFSHGRNKQEVGWKLETLEQEVSASRIRSALNAPATQLRLVLPRRSSRVRSAAFACSTATPVRVCKHRLLLRIPWSSPNRCRSGGSSSLGIPQRVASPELAITTYDPAITCRVHGATHNGRRRRATSSSLRKARSRTRTNTDPSRTTRR